MAELLLEEVNPNGNIQAVVESDDDACYFYLFAAPDTRLEMKSVWSAMTRGLQRLSRLNACCLDLPYTNPHSLPEICEWSGCRKATVRRSTNEMKSWP
jgi:hypothetical protein